MSTTVTLNGRIIDNGMKGARVVHRIEATLRTQITPGDARNGHLTLRDGGPRGPVVLDREFPLGTSQLDGRFKFTKGIHATASGAFGGYALWA